MSLIKSYPLDGTANATVTTGNSGAALVTGPPTWDATGTQLQIDDAVTEYIEDQTANDYCAFVFNATALPSGTDNTIFVCLNASTSLCAIRYKATTGFMAIYSGLGTLVATGTTALTTGVNYRIEHYVNPAGTQEMKLFTEFGTTPLDDLTGATASALAATKRRFGHAHSAQQSGQVFFPSAGIYDAWPNLGAADPWTYQKFARFGT